MKPNLSLPQRTTKPRSSGLTMAIDSGHGAGYFEDAVNNAGEYIDIVKFGWGTAIVTKDFERKLDVVREHQIKHCFGGTLLEKFLQQDRFDEFLQLCAHYSMPVIEVSNGTIPLSNTVKASYISKCAKDFEVVSEVGFKDPGRSEELSSEQWIDAIDEDVRAGSSVVITEARESGSSGICRSDGSLRTELVDEITSSGVTLDKILFEAPNKKMQTHFVQLFGANVNLGNIALSDAIALETLRLGLRSDTFFAFEE